MEQENQNPSGVNAYRPCPRFSKHYGSERPEIGRDLYVCSAGRERR